MMTTALVIMAVLTILLSGRNRTGGGVIVKPPPTPNDLARRPPPPRGSRSTEAEYLAALREHRLKFPQWWEDRQQTPEEYLTDPFNYGVRLQTKWQT